MKDLRNDLAPVVQKVDSTIQPSKSLIHWMEIYPMDSAHPAFEQLRSGGLIQCKDHILSHPVLLS